MTPVFFCDTNVAIVPHTATAAEHINSVVTLGEFAAGQPVEVYRLPNQDMLFRTPDRRQFVEGRVAEAA